jgi:antibiotic biosynthesis monooxygenase (ABM) superfamily enzyme
MDIARTSGDTDQPVKIVLHMRARAGGRDALEAWIKDLVEAAARSADLTGSSVVKSGRDEYIVLVRFVSQARLEQWESTPEVRRLLHRGEDLMESAEEPVRRTGLETWFTLPGLSPPLEGPPKWKMALVTWLALLPQVIALGFVVPRSWPVLVQVAISTAIPVSMLTWFVMPRLTRLLYRWLYGSRAPAPRLAPAPRASSTGGVEAP